MSTDGVDYRRRRFLQTLSGVIGGAGVYCAAKPFTASLLPTVAVQRRGGPITVDISTLKPGALLTVPWRGQPVWVLKRTPQMLAQMQQHRAQLRDPDSLVTQQPVYAQNTFRALRKDFSVLIGVCTHLGCTPAYRESLAASGHSGFHCPCHGSVFDVAGRVFRGVPAPVNLVVPPHYYSGNDSLTIGEDANPSSR